MEACRRACERNEVGIGLLPVSIFAHRGDIGVSRWSLLLYLECRHRGSSAFSIGHFNVTQRGDRRVISTRPTEKMLPSTVCNKVVASFEGHDEEIEGA